MIKVGDYYLDYSEDIDIERQVKLFENIDENAGDFSYSFDLANNSHNNSLLGIPLADSKSKLTNTKIPASIKDKQGITIYDGYIRIEKVNKQKIQCSFFSGNNNWFSELNENISEIDLSDLDFELSESTVYSYRTNTEGIAIPLIDSGELTNRGYYQVKVEDFVPGLYVHTLFKRIFQKHSIKIQGELIEDRLYKSLITIKNSKNIDQIKAASVYTGTTGVNTRVAELTHYKMYFGDTSYPFFDGSSGLFDPITSIWTADAKMRIDTEVFLRPTIVDESYNNRIYLYINGVYTFVDIGLPGVISGLYSSATNGAIDPFFLKRTFTVEAGDTVEVYSEWQQSLDSDENDINSGTWKITPAFIYQVTGDSVAPKWTQQKYVSNILRIFNVITDYDPYSKTITFNFFDKIKSKPYINLSNNIGDIDTDFTDFIQGYSRKNTFTYKKVDFSELRDKNIFDFFTNTDGVIEASNEFLVGADSVVESDFSSPQGYINPVFDISIERTNLVTLKEADSTDITSVSGTNFSIADGIFLVGDIVRISDAEVSQYNGDWVVYYKGSGYVRLTGIGFYGDSTGRMTKLEYNYNETDEVYLMINIPDYDYSDASGASLIIESTYRSHIAIGYFAMLYTGRQINEDYKQSISFGTLNNVDTPSTLFYQRTLLEYSWKLFMGILNDPTKLISNTSYLPAVLFNQIDFLQPIYITSLESSNLYYPSRITGYKNSSEPCIIELIKLP